MLNALTLGAHGELEAIRVAYQSAYADYLAAQASYNAARDDLLASLSKLGIVTQKAMLALEQSYRIILYPVAGSFQNIGSFSTDSMAEAHPKLEHIHQLFSNYSAVESAAGGLGAGSAVAIGSWSLVSIIGTASTGTAISSLTGIAATNATLAWFGGGALAAGGFGMAGGTLLLGGLALVPLVAFSSWHARSKIKDIAAETINVNTEAGRAVERIPELRQAQSEAEQQRRVLINLFADLDRQLAATKRLIFPTRASKVRKFARRLFGKEVFNDHETKAAQSLELAATRVAALFRPAELLPDRSQPSWM